MRGLWRRQPAHERGQGLVEFALVLPIMLLLIVSVAELGVVYGNSQTLVYAAREGARVGSALATGDGDCDLYPSVDAALVGAVQRILKSPDSGIKMANVGEDPHLRGVEHWWRAWSCQRLVARAVRGRRHRSWRGSR